MLGNFFTVFDANWAMTLGSIGTLYFTVKTYKEKAEADRSGIGIKDVTAEGRAEIRNDSRVDSTIKIQKYVLNDGRSEKSSSVFVLDFLNSKDKKSFVQEKIKDLSGVELMPEQVLGSGETASFNVHEMEPGEIYAAFLAMKLMSDGRERLYIYYYANKGKVEKSNLVPEKYIKTLQPYNKWTKMYSF